MKFLRPAVDLKIWGFAMIFLYVPPNDELLAIYDHNPAEY
jgi:hypothetical protein